MIRFDSDYQEGCIPEILDALSRTNYEQTPGYGEDDYCEHARQLIKAACGAPGADVHFLVGGTQTNATVIASVLKPWQGVLCAGPAHINVHETGAVEHTGHKVMALPSHGGKIDAETVEAALAAHSGDPVHEHTVQPGMVYISFPTELGELYSLEELTALSTVCHRWRIPLFIDGARLGYGLSSPACDVTLKDIARLADVFYIGGTKQGALFGEAVVFADPSLSVDFRYSIKQNGGMLAKGRLLGIQFSCLFEEPCAYFSYSSRAIDLAMRIKAAFAAKGYPFLADSFTNQQFPIIPDSLAASLRENFSFEDWNKVDAGHTAVRFVTGWATTEEAVDKLLAAVPEA